KLIDLRMDDETFMRTMFDLLNPGGRMVIYNISPAPAPPDKPYIPWADGRCPFEKSMLEKVGFHVVSFDIDDSQTIRQYAHALGWDAGPQSMNLEGDLFA